MPVERACRVDVGRKVGHGSHPQPVGASRASMVGAIQRMAVTLIGRDKGVGLSNMRMKLTAPLGGLARHGVAGSAAACARATLRRTGAAAYPRCSADAGRRTIGGERWA